MGIQNDRHLDELIYAQYSTRPGQSVTMIDDYSLQAGQYCGLLDSNRLKRMGVDAQGLQDGRCNL